MTPRLSGPFCLFVWFSLCSSLFWELGDKVQWSLEKFAILTLKPRSHVRILIHDGVILGTAAPGFLGTRWLIPWCSRQRKLETAWGGNWAWRQRVIQWLIQGKSWNKICLKTNIKLWIGTHRWQQQQQKLYLNLSIIYWHKTANDRLSAASRIGAAHE